MKLHTVLVLFFILGLISISLNDYAVCAAKLGKKADDARKAFSEKKFIAESFKNTCRGKGFSNLTEWQTCCRQMFSLDYIAWCSSEEFMIDEAQEPGVTLMYGRWLTSDDSSLINGEVYCRTSDIALTRSAY